MGESLTGKVASELLEEIIAEAKETIRDCQERLMEPVSSPLRRYVGSNRIRNEAGVETLWGNSVPYDLIQIADAIDLDVSDGYEPCPKDKNGNPIHVGDLVMSHSRVQPTSVIGIGSGTIFVRNGIGIEAVYHPEDYEIVRDTWEDIEDDARQWASRHSTPSVQWLIDRCKAMSKAQAEI